MADREQIEWDESTLFVCFSFKANSNQIQGIKNKVFALNCGKNIFNREASRFPPYVSEMDVCRSSSNLNH